MTINAFLEAAKKVKPATWKAESRGHSDCAKYERRERTEMFTVEGLEGVSDWEDWGLTEECAEFIAAARNAADEIEELRDWVRDKAVHKYPCYAGMKEHHGEREVVHECTCGLDRIRDLVK